MLGWICCCCCCCCFLVFIQGIRTYSKYTIYRPILVPIRRVCDFSSHKFLIRNRGFVPVEKYLTNSTRYRQHLDRSRQNGEFALQFHLPRPVLFCSERACQGLDRSSILLQLYHRRHLLLFRNYILTKRKFIIYCNVISRVEFVALASRV